MSRFLLRSLRLIETFETNQDKSRFFEIFVGNQDFVEINWDFVKINRDIFSLDRDILDFRHLWKVVGEGFTLTFISLPWAFPHHLPQISTTKINIPIEIYQKSSYFLIEIEKNIEKSRKITKVSICLEKSRSRLKSTVLADLIETKSRNLDLDQDFSIVETNFLKLSRLSIMSRLILFWRRDRVSIETTSRQIKTPMLNSYPSSNKSDSNRKSRYF